MGTKISFKHLKEREKELKISDLRTMYSTLGKDPKHTIKLLERRKK